MPANGTTKATKSTGQTTNKATGQTTSKVDESTVDYVRQTAERSVDVPVGAVLTVADRVNEVVEPWTTPSVS